MSLSQRSLLFLLCKLTIKWCAFCFHQGVEPSGPTTANDKNYRVNIASTGIAALKNKNPRSIASEPLNAKISANAICIQFGSTVLTRRNAVSHHNPERRFNPRTSCGVRLSPVRSNRGVLHVFFNPRAHVGREECERRFRLCKRVSTHAPVGRDDML